MKILIIRPYPGLININNYNVQEIGLAKALNQKGHTCDIVLYNGRKSSRTEHFNFDGGDGTALSFRIYWLKGYGLMKNGFMPAVYRLIPAYDVIQVHEYDQLLSWQLYRKQLKPTVIYHGPYYDFFNKRYNFKCKIFDRFFLKKGRPERCQALAKSHLAADFLRQKGFLNVRTVGVGLDDANFGRVDLAKLINARIRRENEPVRLLYVGKIEERRNLYFLINVYRQLLTAHRNLLLTIVGTGAAEYVTGFLDTIKDLRDAASVRYIEKAAQKDLAAVYAESDLFLFSSNYEIFGMVIAEAMYFGLPVISSTNGGADVLIEDGLNGWQMAGFNEADWADKINTLIIDGSKRQRMGLAAGKRIRAKFLWPQLADGFIDTYRNAMDTYGK